MLCKHAARGLEDGGDGGDRGTAFPVAKTSSCAFGGELFIIDGGDCGRGDNAEQD